MFEAGNAVRMFPQAEGQRLAAAQAAAQASAGAAPVRWSFIARSESGGEVPPMARLVRGGGGRGGATRLKLYLSFLWLARGRELPVFAYPARHLAALLDLPKPDTAGARRVQDALAWLETESFVALDRRAGDATRVHLLDDGGSGKPYRGPGELVARRANLPQKQREKHFYVQLAKEFWTEGWIAILSASATAMYLALLHEQRGRPNVPVWISPQIGRERYDLADDTRNKGLRELVDYRLVDLARRAVPQGAFDERFRARNIYHLPSNAFANVYRRTRSATDANDARA